MKGKNNPMYGKKHSEESKAIMRAKRKLQTMKQQSKK